MPIIKSAKKRVRVAKRAAVRNSKTKRTLKTALKAFLTSAKTDTARKAQSEIDKAAKKGIMHKNKAARKQRQIAARAKAAGVKTGSTVKKAAAKPAAKKTAAKKVAPKKPVAKKSTATKKTAKK